MHYAWTYYVSTERSEGVSATHVEMSRVEPLEEAYVIKTLRLEKDKVINKITMMGMNISILGRIKHYK